MSNNIGEMAGHVWSHLNNNGEMSITKLKSALKADVLTLNAALGWLEREDKVDIGKVKNAMTVYLK